MEESKRPDPVIEIYKGYRIEAFEREEESWRARIQRQDGKKIRVAIPPTELEFFDTSADTSTPEAAVELAKQRIDSGRMN